MERFIRDTYLRDGIAILLISTVSIVIVPDVSSIILNKAVIIELFPAPVRPTIPIFSQGLLSKEMLFNEGIRCSLNLNKLCVTHIFLCNN